MIRPQTDKRKMELNFLLKILPLVSMGVLNFDLCHIRASYGNVQLHEALPNYHMEQFKSNFRIANP